MIFCNTGDVAVIHEVQQSQKNGAADGGCPAPKTPSKDPAGPLAVTVGLALPVLRRVAALFLTQNPIAALLLVRNLLTLAHARRKERAELNAPAVFSPRLK